MERLIGRLSMWNWRITTTAAVVSAGSLILNWKIFPPEIPLLYSRPWGQDQLVHPLALWSLPAISLVIGVAIGLLGKKIAGDGVLRIILLTSSVVIQLIMVTGLLRIILLVA